VVVTAVAGTEVGQLFDGDRRFDITVRVPDATRVNLDDIRSLPVDQPGMLAEVQRIVGDDIEIESVHSDIGLEVPFSGEAIEAMTASLRREDPEAHVLPYLLSGGTDNKALARLGIVGYGFAPLRLPPGTRVTDLGDFWAVFSPRSGQILLLNIDQRLPGGQHDLFLGVYGQLAGPEIIEQHLAHDLQPDRLVVDHGADRAGDLGAGRPVDDRHQRRGRLRHVFICRAQKGAVLVQQPRGFICGGKGGRERFGMRRQRQG